MKNQYLLFLLLLFVFACESKNEKGVEDAQLQLAIVDSIQVDYLGNLFVYDFNSKDGMYLGRSNEVEEYVFFDDLGNISQQFKLQTDGPNKVGYAHGIGFMDGEFTIMEDQIGITQVVNNGQFITRTPLPKEFYFVHGLNFSAVKLDGIYVYPRPERDIQIIRDMLSMIKSAYTDAILEIYDPMTKQIRNTMIFPPNTVYTNGNFYNHSFPNIINLGKEWILFLLAEMKYFVYEERNGEIEFIKEVNLNIEDAIPMPGVPMKEYQEWYEQKGNIIFGKIEQLYRRDDDIVVIYTKGVDEDISVNYDRENKIEWMQFINGIPKYAAVFNNDHQLIQKDIELPKGLIWSSVVNKRGEILALKNQDYFEVEEDFVTFYKLDLASSN